MALHTRLNRFNGGIWSPLLDGRTDLEDYQSALKTCTGFIPLKYGPAKAMQGFEFAAEGKGTDVGLMPFRFSESVNYVIESDGTYMRFYDSSVTDPAAARISIDVGDTINWAASTAYRYGQIVRYGNVNGTGTIAGASATITGTGTAFLTELEIGDYIQDDASKEIREVTDITTDTSLTIASAFSADPAGAAFAKVTLWAFDEFGGGTSAGSFTAGNWHALTQTSTPGVFIYEIPASMTGFVTQSRPQVAQVNDVMYMVNERYQPFTLSRYSETDWRIEALDFTYPPLLDQNTGTTTIGVDAYTGTGATATASADLFVSGHVGTTWEIREERDSQKVLMDLTSGGASVSASIPVFGDFTFTTTGTNWTDTVSIERSVDNFTTTEVVYKAEASGSSQENFTITGSEADPRSLYRIRKTANSTNGVANLSVASIEVKGTFKITAVGGPTSATVDWVQSLDTTAAGTVAATTKWTEAAFSSVQGWPSAVAFFQGRIWYGGTDARKQTVWGSAIDDFGNFGTSVPNVLASDGVQYTISAVEQNKIRWLMPNNDLLVGTVGSEYSISGSDNNAISALSSPLIKPESNVGSYYIQPQIAHNGVIFSSADACKAYHMAYDWRQRGYVSKDLTELNESGISAKFSTYTKDPHNIFWCGAGSTLYGLVYDKENQVQAWFTRTGAINTDSGFVTTGNFGSSTSTYGSTEDDLWIICKIYSDSDLSSLKTIIGRLSRNTTSRNSLNYLDISRNETSLLTNPDPDLGSEYTSVTGAGHLGFYETLTGTITSSGSTVTGTGTAFTTELAVGDYITRGTETVRVATITSDTVLTTSSNLSTSAVGTAFSLAKGRSDVYALVDGLVQGPLQIRGDRLSVEGNPTNVLYGLKYNMEIETMKLQAPAGDGFSRGKEKRASEVALGFDNTLFGKVGITYHEQDGQSGEILNEIQFRTPQDELDDPLPLFTGEKIEKLPHGSYRYFSLKFKQEEPLPATITYMSPQITPKGQ